MTAAGIVAGIAAGIVTVFDDVADLGAGAVTSWPDGDDRLALRLTLPAEDGSAGGTVTMAGRWYRDAARAAGEAAAGALVHGRVVLHPDGLDEALPDVMGHAAAGEVLVAHRVGRRAVLRRPDGSFRKVVRAKRLASLESSSRRAAALPARTPDVLGVERSSVIISALAGRSLHELIRAGEATPGHLESVGAALADLHRTSPTEGLATHDAAAEHAVTLRWAGLARRWGAGSVGQPAVRCAPPAPDRPVLVHRDLHDKQVFLDDLADGFAPGLLDFDLAAAGDPALDLGNLVEHLWWRAGQGLPIDAEACSGALLQGYRPDARTVAALPFYRGLTRDRLGSVYHFRRRAG